jgi:hypothetical protein
MAIARTAVPQNGRIFSIFFPLVVERFSWGNEIPKLPVQQGETALQLWSSGRGTQPYFCGLSKILFAPRGFALWDKLVRF